MKRILSILLLIILTLSGCSNTNNTISAIPNVETTSPNVSQENTQIDNVKIEAENKTSSTEDTANQETDIFNGYTLIEVEGGNRSGHREPNVVVDIGFGDREYWAFTNEYGQLIKVTAEKITLQDDKTEPVLSTGRYYSDEAKVPGVESSTLDEGHVIADSLGGVSNAYNITPQNSTLNRSGDQAYMEKVIRDANGCEDFTAIITYPNTDTQIPNHYSFTYTLKGNVINDEFDNVNPDEVNANLEIATDNSSNESTNNSTVKTTESPTIVPTTNTTVNSTTGLTEADIAKIDTNGNGTVTIAEAKAAGFKMPIKSDHWLYKYMKDGDGDGQVGE